MARRTPKHATKSSWSGRACFLGGAVIASMGIMIGALAAIPDAGGVIHGCYAPTNGFKLRVIDTAKTAKCPSGQVALNWNQKGVPGSPGPQGIQGSPGPAGKPGGGGVFVRSSIDYVIPARTVPVNQGDIYLGLPGGSWVQEAGRLEQFAARAEVVSAPASCTPEDTSESEGNGLVWYMRVIDANGAPVPRGSVRDPSDSACPTSSVRSTCHQTVSSGARTEPNARSSSNFATTASARVSLGRYTWRSKAWHSASDIGVRDGSHRGRTHILHAFDLQCYWYFSNSNE